MLGDISQVTPEQLRKIDHFVENTNDEFADFIVARASKRVLEQPAPVKQSQKRSNKNRPITPNPAY